MEGRPRAKFLQAKRFAFTCLWFDALFCPYFARAQAPPEDLTKMNLEDLMKLEVTSVSRHEESLAKTAAAVFVITQEDIQHSGATNIPDLLRMVPGVQVAQINANSWAISVRGFNGRFSNEVLVMVDGRTVYVPTFGGVFWDVLDLPLEDIERIEVIRGPGGSVWGANAVNGVINIITKKAVATPGTLAVAGGGSTGLTFGTVQHGGKLGDAGNYRLFVKYQNEDSLRNPAGVLSADGWHLLHGGFRADAQLSSRDAISLQGDLYAGNAGVPVLLPPSLASPVAGQATNLIGLSGGFLQATWDHRFSSRSATTLVASYQHYGRSDELGERRGTFDLDFQHNLSIGERQDVTWGFDFRNSSSQTRGSFVISFSSPDNETNLYSGFVQDEIAVIVDKLYLTVGTKLEDHYYTGFGAMPSARIAWTPTTNTALWAAVSRALRTPADIDVMMRVNIGSFPGPGGMPALVSIFGNPNQRNESTLAYETGYRSLLRPNLSVDVAAYYNHYSHGQTTEPAAPFFEASPAPPHLVLPLIMANKMYGVAHGIEAFANWQVFKGWALSPFYSFECLDLHLDPGSLDTTTLDKFVDGTPTHSAGLRSHVTLLRDLSWDTSAYFVDRLNDEHIPSYTRLDSGLTWQWRERFALSIFGQNLLGDRHLEFVDPEHSTTSSLLKRIVYAKLTWRL